MTVKLVTSTGLVAVDLSKYRILSQVWSNKDLERAKPLESVNVPPESNEGGSFNLKLLSALESFRKTSR